MIAVSRRARERIMEGNVKRYGSRPRAGAALVLLAIAIVIALPVSAVAGSKLLCTKDAERPLEELQAVNAKRFPSQPARVSAIELARQRGRSRDGRTTLRFLAIRVEFQPDDDPLSTGDGTFDLSPWDGQTFDGPPHDKEYFELHMTAAKNYFESVSHGAVEIEFDVAPADSHGAYVLPYDMGYYHDYSEDQVWYVSQVEAFTRDAFAAADTTDSLDWDAYDGYVLFFAGSDWQSDIYYDTPYDLPAAHISLGEPILVDGGTHEIWNASLMPETSSQDGLTAVLNGTLVHEMAHSIGLPDLYNTRNFFPSIGYWGIMDSGGRIGMNTPWGYAYGLIPVPPCAWSLEYLGWTEPVVILDDTEDLELKASVLRGGGQRMVKVPITSDEYFLIENRMDDIGKDGLVAIEQERGVVLGPVDPDCTLPICPVNHEYDYLLPGPGMLIYHVDDTRVIPGLMPYDTVNIDRDRRGVAVEEADGIRDLGDIGSFYWTGSRYDPFFASNNDSFSYDTYPSTDDNLGGKSYISVTGITEPDSIMSMDIRFNRWKTGWPIEFEAPTRSVSPRVGDLDGDGDMEVVLATADGLVYAFRHDGAPFLPDCAGPYGFIAVASGHISRTPALADLDGDGDLEVIVVSDDGMLHAWHATDLDGNHHADPVSAHFPVEIGGPASASPLVADLDPGPGLEIAAASRGGDLVIVDQAGRHVATSPYSFGALVLDEVTMAAGNLDGDGESELVLTTTNRGWVTALNADGTPLPGWPVDVPGWESESVGVLLGDIDRADDGRLEVLAVGSDGRAFAWDRAGQSLPGWPVDLEDEVVGRPSLADLDGDGYLELLVPVGATLVRGVRANGTAVENWPLAFSPGDSARSASSSPLVGDIDGDGDQDVLMAGAGGSIFAWDGLTGAMLPGWPLSSDVSLGTPWIGDAELDGELDLLVAGQRGRTLFYRLPYDAEPGTIVWPTEAGDHAGTGCYPDSLLGDEYETTPTLMAHDRTYCYPNPARGEDLTVRVYLEESTDILVEIMDLTGQVVETMRADGVPTVNELVWETGDAASGLYLVRVEVGGERLDPLTASRTGRAEQKLMKVALIR